MAEFLVIARNPLLIHFVELAVLQAVNPVFPSVVTRSSTSLALSDLDNARTTKEDVAYKYVLYISYVAI